VGVSNTLWGSRTRVVLFVEGLNLGVKFMCVKDLMGIGPTQVLGFPFPFLATKGCLTTTRVTNHKLY
jgi:hypothetical protein